MAATPEPSGPPTRKQGGAPAGPPTRKQGAGRPGSPPTRRQGAGGGSDGDPTRVQRAGGVPGPRTGDFPEQLADRYRPLAHAGAGSEGTVWRAERTDGGGEVAVKVGWAGVPADQELLEHLGAEEFRRHVPEIVEHGELVHAGDVRAFLVMEYLPVTLADHLAALRPGGNSGGGGTNGSGSGGGRVRAAEARRVVEGLTDLLDFWQRVIERTPVDFKPANVLVRDRGGRPEFVVADFGGVRKQTASQTFPAELQVTPAYMAPEQLAGRNDAAGPWWALGVMVYEMYAGRSLYERTDGGRVSENAQRERLVLDAVVELPGVTDPRQLLLLSGLLTREPADRWRAAEVREWLAGGSPRVVRPAAAGPAGPAHRPVNFRGEDYRSPAELVEAMMARSAEATGWLGFAGAARLADWLEEIGDNAVDLHLLRAVATAAPLDRDRTASLALLALGVAYAPHVRPHYRGRPVDAEGLAALAAEENASALVRELVQHAVPNHAARFHCAHRRCPRDRCARLLAFDGLPGVVDEAARLAAETGRPFGAADRDRALRLAVLLTARPEARTATVRKITPLPAALAPLPGAVHLAAAVGTDAVRPAVDLLRRADRAADRTADRAAFRRRWPALRRAALAADPATAGGRAALVAADLLSVHAARQRGAGRGRARGAWRDILRDARPNGAGAAAGAVLRALPRRVAAGAVLTLTLALWLWSGLTLRIANDLAAGNSDSDLLGAHFATAAEAASRQLPLVLGAALAAALAVALFPGRVGRRILLLAHAGALAVGLGGWGPPMTVLRTPPWLAERIQLFGSGAGHWSGWVIVAAVPLTVSLGRRIVVPQLAAAHRTSHGGREVPAAPAPGTVARWRHGRREQAAFAVAGTLALTALLWAAVEVRLAVHLPPPGPRPDGAAYQADFLPLLAACSALAALAGAPAARRAFSWLVAGTLLLGAWPPPLGPLEAVRLPVLGSWFRALAELWGQQTFWAALLLALPSACYAGRFALRRTCG
ncbi:MULTISPECIES: serine/threonine protein kinase [Kitasatospora]|uniref:non-specific serine/threonine protein kinase n=1 Tax=Kitasatospora setae (strain ATCC 33774 / DSM 43861 / JCM 3304 / KCC A-0304 / NBRC 14216 / KM-6054) TaxID=452652 RepID=E4N7A4_KITSK|nr:MULTISPECIES: serine/threonine protein kinase [Kitasatospora]BAJ27085.1 putative serine/threonine protein kinase [Kitasatospora setae KM-6054]